MVYRDLLGNDGSDRQTDQRDGRIAYAADEVRGIRREVVGRPRERHTALASPHPPIVEGGAAPSPREVRDLVAMPARADVAASGDEHDIRP